jgi:hypothetical protein
MQPLIALVSNMPLFKQPSNLNMHRRRIPPTQPSRDGILEGPGQDITPEDIASAIH